jgi:uncharacterized protein YaaN involved in tellurite resistance
MGDSLNIDQPSGSAAASGVAASVDAAAASGVAASVDAAPASGVGTLTLIPPAAVAVVAAPQAQDAVKLDPATLTKLDGMVNGYLDAISSLDVKDPKFDARVADIRKLGDDDIKASAQVSSRLLDRPVASMQHGGLSGSSSVSTSLIQLRRQIDDLDPAHQGDLLSAHKILGILPFGDKLRDYFGKYQSSQGHINAIITALYHGQDTLQKDNADLEQEKANLWGIMERLREYIYLAQKLDTGLAARIAQIQTTDPDRAKVLNEDMLFYVRQKVQDLATQLAVSVQGYLALDVIRRNNLELVKGVDRATTTTISALRTAVIVAQALVDQKLVLDQITALNTTTSNLIESTSVMLRQQSGAINEQAASATIDIQKLQHAFDNIYATMDEIDSFKLKALDNMSQTVDALTTQIGKAQTYLDRARPGDQTGDDQSGLNLK